MTEACYLIDSSRRDAIIAMYIAEQFQPIISDCNGYNLTRYNYDVTVGTELTK